MKISCCFDVEFYGDRFILCGYERFHNHLSHRCPISMLLYVEIFGCLYLVLFSCNDADFIVEDQKCCQLALF